MWYEEIFNFSAVYVNLFSVLQRCTHSHSGKVGSLSLLWQEVNKRQSLDVIMTYMSMLPFEIKSNQIQLVSKSKGPLNDVTKYIGKPSINLETINFICVCIYVWFPSVTGK